VGAPLSATEQQTLRHRSHDDPWLLPRGRNVDLFRRAPKLALIIAVSPTLLRLSVGDRFGEAT